MKKGYFGKYGGSFVSPEMQKELDFIEKEFNKLKKDENFKRELIKLQKDYLGRPSPLYYCENLTKKVGGAKIYLKREDLNYTGAHKINHCIGEALLAKYLGKKKIIAETGAGQHGVAIATVCALMNLECEVHMGSLDIEKQKSNVEKMRLLGANVVGVTSGNGTLKDAVDSALRAYQIDFKNSIYCIGSVVGPHPYPQIVRYFQSVIGKDMEPARVCVYELVMSKLASYLGNIRKYDESNEMSDRILKECLSHRRMVSLSDNLYNNLWNNQKKNTEYKKSNTKNYLQRCILLSEITKKDSWMRFFQDKIHEVQSN